jgi:predicted transposase/invertase (TIGR01784 family)
MQSSNAGPPSENFHQNPHDSLFRATFSQPENALGLLHYLLPKDALVHFNFNTLKLQSASFIDQHLKNLYSDLLFAIELNDGRSALIYILFEHQSSGEPWMPLRMLAYQVRIWENSSRRIPIQKN